MSQSELEGEVRKPAFFGWLAASQGACCKAGDMYGLPIFSGKTPSLGLKRDCTNCNEIWKPSSSRAGQKSGARIRGVAVATFTSEGLLECSGSTEPSIVCGRGVEMARSTPP